MFHDFFFRFSLIRKNETFWAFFEHCNRLKKDVRICQILGEHTVLESLLVAHSMWLVRVASAAVIAEQLAVP